MYLRNHWKRSEFGLNGRYWLIFVKRMFFKTECPPKTTQFQKVANHFS